MVVATGGSTPGTPDGVVELKESTGAQVGFLDHFGHCGNVVSQGYPDLFVADAVAGVSSDSHALDLAPGDFWATFYLGGFEAE
jgi:hypothetical protein